MTTADRLIFSTDYPFQQPSRAEIEGFLAEVADVRAFSYGNAAALYGITSPAIGR